MKTRNVLAALALTVGVFTACTDKKKTEEKVETVVVSEVKSTTIKDTSDEDEKIRLDSIRQVKEHGHAH